MIEVKDLTKKYGKHVAVDHLTFQVEDGQIYGFLGPNGAGKSTTMNMMTGYLAASEGSVLINGSDILKDPIAAKKSIGYLPEFPPLYQDMTVREYLSFAAELKKVEKTLRKKEVEAVMEETLITDVADRLIRNLSKGYKQRVGLAQALLGEPDVIILDEPTVGLDPKQIIEIRDLIKKLGGTHTVILSSHILSEVSAVCDKIMIINEGKLVALDTPEGLQAKSSAGKVMELTLGCDRAKAESIFAGIGGIIGTEYLEGEKSGTILVRIKVDPNQDPSQNIFYACAGAQVAILGMTTKEESLEDIFLELTSAPSENDSGKSAAEETAAEETAEEEKPDEEGLE